jgi:pimeloyl-ACP methyl ester carboxylesterase
MRGRHAVMTLAMLAGMFFPGFSSSVMPPTPAPALAAQATPDAGMHDVDPRLRDSIEAAVPPDTGRGVIRFPAIWMDDSGDLSVVVALRERDDVDGFRAAAEEDVFNILRAVYTLPDSSVSTMTVVGTYSVTEDRGARELPILRVVLSAAHAATIDWQRASPQDLFSAADVYRFIPPFGDEAGQPLPPATPAASPVATPEDQVISSPINIGGRLLFLRCIGSGGPTVILEAGYGDNGTSWAPVQIHASEFVRVCSYDRAGLERSDPPDHYPRTGAEVVSDLHALLQAADVQPPYLLVGQGHGTLFSRLFAATYPDEVAGLLLLDPWPETFDRELQALVTDSQWQEYQALLAAEPDNEVIDFAATYQELRAAGPLPDVPLVVLSHGQSPAAAGFPAEWPVTQQEQLWQRLQQHLATLTPGGKQEVVPASGDMIQQAKPEVVVAAIRDLVDQIRR